MEGPPNEIELVELSRVWDPASDIVDLEDFNSGSQSEGHSPDEDKQPLAKPRQHDCKSTESRVRFARHVLALLAAHIVRQLGAKSGLNHGSFSRCLASGSSSSYTRPTVGGNSSSRALFSPRVKRPGEAVTGMDVETHVGTEAVGFEAQTRLRMSAAQGPMTDDRNLVGSHQFGPRKKSFGRPFVAYAGAGMAVLDLHVEFISWVVVDGGGVM